MSKTALLVIDAQEALVTGAYHEADVLQSINKVIDKVRKNEGLVVFIQHNHATWAPMVRNSPGWQIHHELHRAAEDKVIEKTASDAFFDTLLSATLQAFDIAKVIITGLQTEYCVDTTCRAALSEGYVVTLISDAHTTGDSHIPASEIIAHHNAILANIAHPLSLTQGFSIQVVTADEYVAQ